MITGNEPAMPLEDVGFNAETGNISFEAAKYDFKINFTGLTIRQYFAAMAMQGILANPEFLTNYKDFDIHAAAVKNADYLIAELNK